MDAAKLPKISADSHIDEPHDLWFERMDRRPPRPGAPADPGRSTTAAGAWSSTTTRSGGTTSHGRGGGAPTSRGGSRGVARRAARDAAHRLRERRDRLPHDRALRVEHQGPRRSDGGLHGLQRLDPRTPRWHERIRLAAMIPTWDLDDGDRRGAAHGRGATSVGGLLLPLVGHPEWNPPEWEPLWAAHPETSASPVVMHQGTGHDMIFYRGWGSPTANLLATQSMAPRAAALLSCSGVLERHPDLHVVLVEVNAGWMAWTMSTLDEYYLAHRRHRVDETDPGRAAEPLPPPPGPRDVPGRPRRDPQHPARPAPTACCGATTSRTPRARTRTRTRCSTCS